MGVLVAQCRVCGGYRESSSATMQSTWFGYQDGIIDLNIPTRRVAVRTMAHGEGVLGKETSMTIIRGDPLTGGVDHG